jgi:DNA (cytosine-5)-methyltransferase 1
MRVVDLFAGCGGMSLGFQEAGFDVVAAFDHWQPAISVYQQNFAHPIFNLDLADNQATSIIKSYSADVIIGGPPCQDFSSAGKRDETLGRGDLTVAFAQLVAASRPRYFVMENVERITKTKIYHQALKILRQEGYAFTHEVLRASLCGVPQDRKRYFLIGELDGVDNRIAPYLQKNLSETPLTVFDCLGDIGIEYYYRHPRNYSRRAIYSVHEPSPTIRGVNRPVPAGYKGHAADASPVFDGLRPLTTLERSYVQTFPKTFKFSGTKSNLEQMIGNAVPVKLAQYVASALMDYIADKEQANLPEMLIQMPLF